MHQFLSAVAQFFLSPFNWIVLLAVAAFLSKSRKWKKGLYAGALIVFLVFSNAFLLRSVTRGWQSARSRLQPSQPYSCAILLGGFASMDAEGYPYFNGAANRFIQALRLYKTGTVQNILITGGNSKKNNFSEARWAKQELITLGVPDSVILTEDRSNNTHDNARHAKQLLAENRLSPPYLLITSATHMPRATLLFREQGVTTVPYSSDYVAGGAPGPGSFLPDPAILASWPGFLKEVMGYVWYKNF